MGVISKPETVVPIRVCRNVAIGGKNYRAGETARLPLDVAAILLNGNDGSVDRATGVETEIEGLRIDMAIHELRVYLRRGSSLIERRGG